MQKLLTFTFAAIIFFGLATPVFAAKTRIRFKASGVSFSSAKISRSTHSVILNLLNLNKVAKVNYTLSYATNGVNQGVVGSIMPRGQAGDSRNLYFGTCSKGVCTPHYNITNASLLVETTLISGAVNAKRYRIKI